VGTDIDKLRGRLTSNQIRLDLNRVLKRFDLGLYRQSEVEAKQGILARGRDDLPEGAAERLRPDHPRIAELGSAYADHPASDLSVWSDHRLKGQIDLRYFRGDTQYLYQDRGTSELAYRLSYDVARSSDSLGLFDRVNEDGSFGAIAFEIEGVAVSRDLIDSVLELNYLSEMLGAGSLDDINLLDIGAGYGRLPHRLLQAFPGATASATDAVPISTFLCEYFLSEHLGLSNASVVPLHKFSEHLESQSFDVAVNIHSWPETTTNSVHWWLQQLADHDVNRILIIHGSETLFTRSHQLSEEPFEPLLERFGYRRVDLRPKYSDPLAQRLGAFPAFYHFFER